MRSYANKEKKSRNRPRSIKRWTHSDETNIIKFLKQNRDFENPTARLYYTKFMDEYEMDINWKLVLYKVRNMRTVYRRAKEYQINRKDSDDADNHEIRSVMTTICWYVDDFDDLFPHDAEICTKPNAKEFSSGDESSNQESVSNNDNLNSTSTHFNEPSLSERPTVSFLPKSIERDILAVQTGKLSYKRQKFDEDATTKQQDLELSRDKLNFEKEKFRQEIRVKEKEIDSRERLKIMELQMQERIAMRELELKEKLALHSMEKQEPTYNNVYHNMQ